MLQLLAFSTRKEMLRAVNQNGYFNFLELLMINTNAFWVLLNMQ